jgi:hypothetical protein
MPLTDGDPVIVGTASPAVNVCDDAVTVSATALVIAKVTDAVADPEVAPVAVIVIVADDAAVGVPVITPVEELIDKPVGKAPVVTA